MGFLDLFRGWFSSNRDKMTPDVRREVEGLIRCLESKVEQDINSSNFAVMSKMQRIMDEQNRRILDDVDRNRSIHDLQIKNMAKSIAKLEAELEKEKKGKEEGAKEKGKSDGEGNETSTEKMLRDLITTLTSTQFMGHAPQPGSVPPAPQPGSVPGQWPAYGAYGPGPGPYGPSPGMPYGPGYGPGPGPGYGPGPGPGYGPGPGMPFGPGPSGYKQHPNELGPGPSGYYSRPGPSGYNSRPSFNGSNSRPNNPCDQKKKIEQNVQNFFKNVENLPSSNSGKTVDPAMPLIITKNATSAQTSQSVENWLNKNENFLPENQESDSDKNSVMSGQTERSIRSNASFTGKRVFTNPQRNSNQQKFKGKNRPPTPSPSQCKGDADSSKNEPQKTFKKKNKFNHRRNLTKYNDSENDSKLESVDCKVEAKDQDDATLNIVNYPSEEDAKLKNLDLQDQLKTPVMFIGKTEDGSMESHMPKCLAQLYELEKKYKTFKVITL